MALQLKVPKESLNQNKKLECDKKKEEDEECVMVSLNSSVEKFGKPRRQKKSIVNVCRSQYQERMRGIREFIADVSDLSAQFVNQHLQSTFRENPSDFRVQMSGDILVNDPRNDHVDEEILTKRELTDILARNLSIVQDRTQVSKEQTREFLRSTKKSIKGSPKYQLPPVNSNDIQEKRKIRLHEST